MSAVGNEYSSPDSSQLTIRQEWPEWAREVAPQISKGRQDLFTEFLHWMSQNAKGICIGEPGITLEKSEHQRLRDKLSADLSRDVRDELLCIEWWNRLITAGCSQERWKIELCGAVVRIPPPPTTFVRRDFQLLQTYRQLEQKFQQLLQGVIADVQLCHAVLLSAVVNCGVTDSDLLSALAKWTGMFIRTSHGRIRVVLEITRNGRIARSQAWFPDSVTSTLLVRCAAAGCLVADPKGVDQDSSQKLLTAIEVFGLPSMDAPELLRAASVATAMKIPPFLREYLGGAIRAASLCQATWQRLNGWSFVPLTKDSDALVDVDTSNVEVDLSAVTSKFSPGAKFVSQGSIIREILRALRSSNHDALEKIDDVIRKNGTSVWPVTLWLAYWIRWRIGAPLNDKQPEVGAATVARSTAHRYLATIARHLIAVCECEELLQFEQDDFEDLYEMAAARLKTDGERSKFWGCIHSFHTFLTFRGAPPIQFDELDGYMMSTSTGVSVTANLVSERDFLNFKTVLLNTEQPNLDSPRVVTFLVGMLGFRCGLRRREIQMLWTDDLFGDDNAVLVVRASRLATLKSRNARRRMPLAALLPADELKLLLSYQQRRTAQLEGHSALLFCNPEAPRVPLDDVVMFRPITQIFQRICAGSGPQFRFHHLRHSFGNWLLLRLLAADNPDLVNSDEPFLPHKDERDNWTKQLKEKLFVRALGTELQPSRKNLYLVSSLLGHLSPDTSLRHYLHLIDWLAGREIELALAEALKGWSAESLRNLCGLSPSAPYKPPYRALIKKPIEFLRQFVFQRAPKEWVEVKSMDLGPIDFSDIVERLGQPLLPGPSRMMVLLANMVTAASDPGWQRKSGKSSLAMQAVLERLERNHCIPEKQLLSLYEDYLKLHAKQSMGEAKVLLRIPGPPRTVEDRFEFWRILDVSVAAREKPHRWAAMVCAAGFLVNRNGPKSGNVYFGKRWASAPVVVDGLIAMGVPVTKLELIVREEMPGAKRALQMREIADQVAQRGVTTRVDKLDWEKRKSAGATLLLRISDERDSRSTHKKPQRFLGRMMGVNYAAIWVLFVESIQAVKTKALADCVQLQ
ncbi:hypothetical protein [Rhodoferax sp. GW822-FHT02A01]|uniref:tyrosine-type recombinase/integrase n=1 Tax=Rhodoferax sp. GW822-FHT02A01 TaxID=3141537 RepID=UPI00315CA43E